MIEYIKLKIPVDLLQVIGVNPYDTCGKKKNDDSIVNEIRDSFGKSIKYYEETKDDGRNEAWELARKIFLGRHAGMEYDEYKGSFEIFDDGLNPLTYCIYSHAYHEVKEAHDKYLKEQENKKGICPGDIVLYHCHNTYKRILVTVVRPDGFLYGMDSNGVQHMALTEYCKKTDVHIDVDSMLQKIRGDIDA